MRASNHEKIFICGRSVSLTTCNKEHEPHRVFLPCLTASVLIHFYCTGGKSRTEAKREGKKMMAYL